jgi:protein-L-isoaspartate(D-aspartate) O-methyltransferase
VAIAAVAMSCRADLESDRRGAMVEQIRTAVQETGDHLGTATLDPAVLEAMNRVPRHEFVPIALRDEAYADRPLPIGDGQTISQPYTVAVMSHLAAVKSGDRVFELGTGSGYQAAVLAEMGAEVYSAEIIPALAERARRTLQHLGYDRVRVRLGDGYLGWPEAAPFDAIVVTAAGDHIPQPLVEQLKTGGRLVMPVGAVFQVQQLIVLEKDNDGTLRPREVLPVRFVPITGDH